MWQCHQLDHMQTICTSLQTDNLITQIFLFLMPNHVKALTAASHDKALYKSTFTYLLTYSLPGLPSRKFRRWLLSVFVGKMTRYGTIIASQKLMRAVGHATKVVHATLDGFSVSLQASNATARTPSPPLIPSPTPSPFPIVHSSVAGFQKIVR